MATKLTKSTAREVPSWVRTPKRMRPLIATLTPDGIELRAKGTRQTYLVPYGIAWITGAKLYAAAQVAEKKSAQIARRAARVSR